MAQPFKIFIVEDDEWYGEVLEYLLKLNPEFQVERFASGKECLNNLHQKPSVITLDYSLEDMNGSEVLAKIRAHDSSIPVIMISGQDDVSTALNLLREGAYDYIVKDDEAKDRLWNAVKNVREKAELKTELEDLRQEIVTRYDFANLIGTSTPIIKVKQLMEKAVQTNITVSITGETGSGKEVVAKGLHYNSNRRKKSFIAVNVAAIPSELIESELFGYEKGSFTGADSARLGKFEEADGGTLFLDEIGEMPANMQSKLLRVLQEKEITRIGSSKTRKVDVRLVVATHKNLSHEVEAGNFREDLYYRLLGLPIELPPLRSRGNDILMLARHFVDAFGKENGLDKIEITESAREKLLKYSFPGNVRELKALMELGSVMCNGNKIQDTDITFTSTRGISGLLIEEQSLKEYTIGIINHYLEKYNNNVLLVAQKLDIGKSTIYRMLKEE